MHILFYQSFNPDGFFSKEEEKREKRKIEVKRGPIFCTYIILFSSVGRPIIRGYSEATVPWELADAMSLIICTL